MMTLSRNKYPFMKIVIADDSSIFRDRIKSLLNCIQNVSVVGEAENGAKALQLIMDKKPDLAILDIRMPELNGLEVLKIIKVMKMKVTVCILTTHSNQLYRSRCLDAGADFFISKTDDFEEINIFITNMLMKE